MESLDRSLCILIALLALLLSSYTTSAQPQILGIQYNTHNHTELPEYLIPKERHRNCDAICKTLKDLQVESDIVKLSSQKLRTQALRTYEWHMVGLCEIIYTMMHLKYLRQPVPM